MNHKFKRSRRCEGFQRATGKPFGRARRRETLQDDVSSTWEIPRLRARAEGFPVALCTPSGTPSDEVDLFQMKLIYFGRSRLIMQLSCADRMKEQSIQFAKRDS